MLAYKITENNDHVTITESTGDTITSRFLDELLDFMLFAKDPTEFKTFFNLDNAIIPLLQKIESYNLEKLWQTNRCFVRPYSIIYNPHKSFYIVKGAQKAMFYHIEQYFPDTLEPKTAKEIEILGTQILDELKTIDIYPRRLSSPVAIFDDIFNDLDLPNWEDIPLEVDKMAEECTRKPLTCAYKLGYFDKAYDYDIVSGYPSIAASLYDIREGKWWQHDYKPDWVVYGFALCDINIWADYSPIVIDNWKELSCKKGQFEKCLSKGMMDFIDRWEIGKYKVIDGWWWYPTKREKPLKNVMQNLFGQRINPPLLSRIIKGAMVGICGKFIQEYRDKDAVRLAPSNNLVWGAIINDEITLQVMNFIYENNLQKELLHISTDGCLVTKKVEGIKTNGEAQMGEWRLDGEGQALVISSGCLYYGKKKPNSLSIEQALELVKEHPERRDWGKEIKRRLTLGDALLNRGDFGKLKSVVTGFSLPMEHDRNFKEVPKTGEELLNRIYESTAEETQ